MSTATLTSKGQLTIPKAMRDELKLKAGDRIDFVKVESGQYAGQYVLRPANQDVRSLFGGLADLYDGSAVSVEEMDAGIRAAVHAKHARTTKSVKKPAYK
ncbi:MAG: AbrB/MazE/SpoVT family DNA-binding domain-containing protein [Gammaproteobacteria bacterium]|nr:AbrB/MazE/SpoVT family DNA-binding domain-containing protein [Gammaproteobacteria bacterium]